MVRVSIVRTDNLMWSLTGLLPDFDHLKDAALDCCFGETAKHPQTKYRRPNADLRVGIRQNV